MTAYNAKFYDRIRNGCRDSAQATLLALEPNLRPRCGSFPRVVDVGCGEGWWGRYFSGSGAFVQGFDGGATPDAQIPVTACDLTERIPTDDKFDIAICLEVAEHLPESAADHIVSELCRLAPTVLFSAAMPRQGGTGHINCQPPAYWAEKFAEHGLGCDDEIRLSLWDHPDIEPWYKSNLLLFSTDLTGTRALHLIHPDLWLGRR